MPRLPKIQSDEILQNLKQSLSSLPGVELKDFINEPTDIDAGIDASAKIKIKDKKVINLLIQVKLSGYPRDLEKASQTLKAVRRINNNQETIPVIVSRAVSTGSRKKLIDQGVGYFDSGGSLYLPLAENIFYIDRSPPQPERKLQNIYEGRSAQVLHILLAEPARKWHVNELAERAEVSAYTVHQVFTRLEEELLLTRCGKGPECVRFLENPGQLLDAWTENYSFKQYRFQNYYKWSQSTETLRAEITNLLEENKIDYALTLSSGAELVAPFATGERLHLIIPESGKFEKLMINAGFEPVDEGANVTFMITQSRAPFLNRQKVDNIWVAGNVQLYLDLSKWRARGKEQAEHLRRQRLKF